MGDCRAVEGVALLALFFQPDFYYAGTEGQTVRNLWFGINGAFLTLYAAGCVILLDIVMKKTAYIPAARAAAR